MIKWYKNLGKQRKWDVRVIAVLGFLTIVNLAIVIELGVVTSAYLGAITC